MLSPTPCEQFPCIVFLLFVSLYPFLSVLYPFCFYLCPCILFICPLSILLLFMSLYPFYLSFIHIITFSHCVFLSVIDRDSCLHQIVLTTHHSHSHHGDDWIVVYHNVHNSQSVLGHSHGYDMDMEMLARRPILPGEANLARFGQILGSYWSKFPHLDSYWPAVVMGAMLQPGYVW